VIAISLRLYQLRWDAPFVETEDMSSLLPRGQHMRKSQSAFADGLDGNEADHKSASNS
jgi:hypothetical protein